MTVINLLLVVGSLWVLHRIFELSHVEAMAISMLWLIDSHLSYALSVAAIPEFLELFLIVTSVLLLRNRKPSAQYLAGALIGIGAVIKLVPLIMLPLLFFRRSHTVYRISACIGTIMTVITATAVGLRIPLLTALKESFIPAQAAQNAGLEGRSLLSIFTPQTNSQFYSLSGSIARLAKVEPTSINGTIIGVISVVVIAILYFAAISYTVALRRRGSTVADPRDPGMLLVAGLYLSLLPMINIAHKHTYLFLIPTYALIYYAASRLFSPRKRNQLLVIGGMLYLWSSQGLVAATLTHLGISHPAILHEEAIPHLALTVLIVIIICLYERQRGFGRDGQLEPPTRELADPTSQTQQGVPRR
ncbi:MAG: glycosyltransferase family 87 protein [Actinomycetota bacterium]|nr:glycosyltransferase family 87 protein [Actinomycetota bacterium]